MPSKYRIKEYVEGSYYHVFNRGVGKRCIYKDDEDYTVFTRLLARYLVKERPVDSSGREYADLRGQVELNAYCLMPNHFHMLVQLKEHEGMTKLMQGVCTAYTMYFNKKYKRVGPLFQDRFKASKIDNDAYLQHISRYIHLNPEDYKGWEYSSLKYYLDDSSVSWLTVAPIKSMFNSTQDYSNFLRDYKGYRATLKEIKHELADQ